MSLAYGQCFLKVLYVYKEFCDYESGTLLTSDVILLSVVVLRHLTFHIIILNNNSDIIILKIG